MTIPFTKYIDVVSGVGGANQVSQRELIGRLFTTNPLLPTKSFAEFDDEDPVGEYFGFSSEEYKRALFYFGFIAKDTVRPKKISFARWADADTAPLIFSESDDYLVATFTGINDGAFALTLGGDTEVITGLDFTTDVSLADVAATIETGIQAANVAAVWTSATVTYNTTDKRFDFVGGDTGNFAVVVAEAGAGTEIAELIGWLNAGTILSDGVVEETVTTALTESASASNNFGSFLFMPTLSIDEMVDAATWNKAQNVRFQFYDSVLEVDAQDAYDALKDLGGTGMHIHSASAVDEYPEMMPMMIMAATDYTRENANKNYMYHQFAISATVDDGVVSNTLDALRINYYGETQQAGRVLSFYQRGVLMGLATDPLDMNTYANEQWFKDANSVTLMNLLLALNALPANDDGRVTVLGALQDNIELAIRNGTILLAKALNTTQKAYVLSVTGDENAWRQIESQGYWIDATVQEPTPNEFKIVYLLLYAKGDAIRKIEGTQTLI